MHLSNAHHGQIHVLCEIIQIMYEIPDCKAEIKCLTYLKICPKYYRPRFYPHASIKKIECVFTTKNYR